MSITAERKTALINEYAHKAGDTGSPEVQVAILLERINNLTEHSRATRRTTIPAAACSSWCRSAARFSTISRSEDEAATAALIERLGMRR